MKIELAHDALAAKVYDKVSLEDKTLRKVEKFIKDRYAFYLSRKALMTQDDLDYITPYLDKVDIGEEERKFIDRSFASTKKKKRQRMFLLFVFLLVSALAAFSFYQANEARIQRDEALKEKKRADKLAILAGLRADTAIIERLRADSLRGFAQLQTDTAISERNRANLLRILARLQADTAIIERLRADALRDLAQLQADTANLERLRADTLKDLAQLQADTAIIERNRANTLFYLSLAQSVAARSLQVEDKTLKALLAQYAYQFHKDNDGQSPDRNIYTSLYRAAKKLKGSTFNEYKGQRTAIWSIELEKERLFAAANDGKILSWDWGSPGSDGSETANSPILPKINPDRKKISGMTEDNSVLIKKIKANPIFNNSTDSVDNSITAVCSHPTRDVMAIGTKGGKVFLYDIKNDTLSDPLPSQTARISELAFSPDGSYLASASYDRTVLLYPMGNERYDERLPILLDDHDSWVTAMIFSADGAYLITGTRDGQVKRWPTQTQQLAELLNAEIGQDTLTQQQWDLYIGKDIKRNQASQ